MRSRWLLAFLLLACWPAYAQLMRGAPSTFTGVPPYNTVAPVIAGTGGVGNTLTVSSTGTFGGTLPITDTCQWWQDSSNTQIPGATSCSSYVQQSTDAGHALNVTVTATNSYGSAAAPSNNITVPPTGVPTVVAGAYKPLINGSGVWQMPPVLTDSDIGVVTNTFNPTVRWASPNFQTITATTTFCLVAYSNAGTGGLTAPAWEPPGEGWTAGSFRPLDTGIDHVDFHLNGGGAATEYTNNGVSAGNLGLYGSWPSASACPESITDSSNSTITAGTNLHNMAAVIVDPSTFPDGWNYLTAAVVSHRGDVMTMQSQRNVTSITTSSGVPTMFTIQAHGYWAFSSSNSMWVTPVASSCAGLTVGTPYRIRQGTSPTNFQKNQFSLTTGITDTTFVDLTGCSYTSGGIVLQPLGSMPWGTYYSTSNNTQGYVPTDYGAQGLWFFNNYHGTATPKTFVVDNIAGSDAPGCGSSGSPCASYAYAIDTVDDPNGGTGTAFSQQTCSLGTNACLKGTGVRTGQAMIPVTTYGSGSDKLMVYVPYWVKTVSDAGAPCSGQCFGLYTSPDSDGVLIPAPSPSVTLAQDTGGDAFKFVASLAQPQNYVLQGVKPHLQIGRWMDFEPNDPTTGYIATGGAPRVTISDFGVGVAGVNAQMVHIYNMGVCGRQDVNVSYCDANVINGTTATKAITISLFSGTQPSGWNFSGGATGWSGGWAAGQYSNSQGWWLDHAQWAGPSPQVSNAVPRDQAWNFTQYATYTTETGAYMSDQAYAKWNVHITNPSGRFIGEANGLAMNNYVDTPSLYYFGNSGSLVTTIAANVSPAANVYNGNTYIRLNAMSPNILVQNGPALPYGNQKDLWNVPWNNGWNFAGGSSCGDGGSDSCVLDCYDPTGAASQCSSTILSDGNPICTAGTACIEVKSATTSTLLSGNTIQVGSSLHADTQHFIYATPDDIVVLNNQVIHVLANWLLGGSSNPPYNESEVYAYNSITPPVGTTYTSGMPEFSAWTNVYIKANDLSNPYQSNSAGFNFYDGFVWDGTYLHRWGGGNPVAGSTIYCFNSSAGAACPHYP